MLHRSWNEVPHRSDQLRETADADPSSLPDGAYDQDAQQGWMSAHRLRRHLRPR